MAQCINTYCLHSQDSDQLSCEACGCSLVVDDYLLVNCLLGSDHPFSSSRTRTFDATNLETGEAVILRVVHSDEPLYVQPLQDTAIALSQVHSDAPHPGVMRLQEDRGYFTWQIRPDEPPAHFLVAHKVVGITLREWLEQNGPALEEVVIEWLRQLLGAADALHSLGFVHRDIKPDNIIVTSEQRLVLIDFDAICRLTDDFVEVPSMGTPTYIAPEQAKGHPRPASDYFSIGKTAVELLTGKATFEVARTAAKKIDWAKAAPHVSTPLTELVDRLASDNTMRRPADVGEAYEFLSEAEALSASRQWWHRLNVPALRTALLILVVSTVSIGIGAISFSQTSPRTNNSPAGDARIVTEAQSLLAEGNQLILSGQEREGLALIEQALELEPESAEIRAALAIAQFFVGDIESAIENYDIVLSMEPGNPYNLYNLAGVYEEVDVEQAITYYIAASEIESPIRISALNNLSRLYLLAGDLQQAETVLGEIDLADVEQEDPQNQMNVFKNLGWLKYLQGDLDAAEVQLARALDADPTQPDAYCLLALIQKDRGEDNFNDEITCLNLRILVPKPELDEWKARLNEAQ